MTPACRSPHPSPPNSTASAATWNAFVLEALAPRPLAAMPALVLDDMETSHASIFAVEVQPNELHSRMQMTDVVNRRRMRHAHMVNITGEIMTQGMRADFNDIDRISQAVLERLRAATYIRATTPAGTDIHAQLTPAHRWFKTSGIISPGRWGNLPGGECYTAPGEVNGVFVVDGVAGDFLCKRYGILHGRPAHHRYRRQPHRPRPLRQQGPRARLLAYTHTDANSNRVGEIAIGTNIGVERVIGNILQDEKLPGVHLAFGDPYGAQTGAPWKSSHPPRRRRPRLQHLARRRQRRRADHAQRRIHPRRVDTPVPLHAHHRSSSLQLNRARETECCSPGEYAGAGPARTPAVPS